jgi:hypothetical protein
MKLAPPALLLFKNNNNNFYNKFIRSKPARADLVVFVFECIVAKRLAQEHHTQRVEF